MASVPSGASQPPSNRSRLIVDYERACDIGSVRIQAESIAFAAKKTCIVIGVFFASRIGPKQSMVKQSLVAGQLKVKRI